MQTPQEQIQQATRVALLVRLIGILADRPVLAIGDDEERARAMFGPTAWEGRPLVEAHLVANAGPVDMIAAEAVRAWRVERPSPQAVEIVATIGEVSPEHLAAIGWCLPEWKRRTLHDRHIAFAVAMDSVAQFMPAALRETDATIAEVGEGGPLTRTFCRAEYGLATADETQDELARIGQEITRERGGDGHDD